jgi:ribosome maturation factor RimP
MLNFPLLWLLKGNGFFPLQNEREDMIDAEIIRRVAEQGVEGSDLTVADVRVRPVNRVTVTISATRPVTIDDCAVLTRHIRKALPPEPEDYSLEVSSPGI